MSMYFYTKKTMTAGELTKFLEEMVACYSSANEDELVSCHISLYGTDAIIGDILNNHSEFHHLKTNQMEELMSYVPPHVLFDYDRSPRECAEDNDYFYDRLNEVQQEILHDDIMKHIPDEIKEKHGIEF